MRLAGRSGLYRFLFLLLARSAREIGAALHQHVTVTAGILGPAAVPLRGNHATHQAIEKIAIVADEQDRAGVFAEHVLKHVERFHVEIVGRLVEHQQI